MLNHNLTSKAFVLKKRDFKESDKIVTFFTRKFGKVTAIGKFAKKSIKRNLNLLDYGILIKVYLTTNKKNSEFYFIEKIEYIKKFFYKTNYKNLYIISYLNELLLNVVYENDNSEDIFNLVENFYIHINNLEQKNKKIILLSLFQLKLLEALGYKIKLDSCIICGKPGDFNEYSLEKIGFICNNCVCNNRITICDGTKKVISQLNKIEYQNLNFSNQILNELDTIFYENLKKIITSSAFRKLSLYRNILNNGI